MAVKKGDTVKVEYEGKLDDGTVFDSSKKHGQPLEFEAGAGKVIPGFDNAVIGMEEGEEKTVKIDVKDAYGERNDQLVKEVPRTQMPEGDIKEGMMLGVGLPNGQQVPATISKVEAETVTLDLNHPLAGKNLTFEIKVIGISS
jgi:peptidylprolyl isomerase